MDHLLINRSADRIGEAVITFERRQRAGIADHLLGSPIDLYRSDSRLNHLPEILKDQPNQLSGGPHFLQLFLRLPDNHKIEPGNKSLVTCHLSLFTSLSISL